MQFDFNEILRQQAAHINSLSAALRNRDKILEGLQQGHRDLAAAVQRIEVRAESSRSDVMRIEDIPGTRIPYFLLVEIPVPDNVTSKLENSTIITQEGPFVAVKQVATFLSAHQFQSVDPISGQISNFTGRSYGRYRPIHSAWDINDSQHNAISDAGIWTMNQLLNMGALQPFDLPQASLGLPSNMSSFRTMQFDGRIGVAVHGAEFPRQNTMVPSSLWVSQINDPQSLGALDFFERGTTVVFSVQPTHPNNPSFGNVGGLDVWPNAAAAGWPFVNGQYDAHEGIATPGASTVNTDTDPRWPSLLANDSISRMPTGTLIIGYLGYRILQTMGPVG